MADRLKLYNGALAHCGERRLASLTENREPRRLLDDVWDGGAVVRRVLEMGFFNFGTRSIEMIPEAEIEPLFGFTKAYAVPADFARVVRFSSEERLETPLTDREFRQEGGYFFADLEPLYLSYVSADPQYGGDLSLWPESFTAFVEAFLAWRINPRLTGSRTDTETLFRLQKRLLVEAQSVDAMNQGLTLKPAGSWNRARRGGSMRYRSRALD